MWETDIFPRSADEKNSERSKRRKTPLHPDFTGVSPYSDSAFQELEPSISPWMISFKGIKPHQGIRAIQKAETLHQEGTSKRGRSQNGRALQENLPCPLQAEKVQGGC